MLTLLLSFIAFLILNTIAQSDIKAAQSAKTLAVLAVVPLPELKKTIRKRQKFSPEFIATIDLSVLLP